MPIARKTSGGRQATLSFNHRVTKASVQRQSAKEAALLTDKADKADKADKVDKVEQVDKKKDQELDKKAKIEVNDEREAKLEEAEEDEDDDKATQASAPAPVVRSEAEVKADAITDTQIRQYWRAIESQSIARRVHQEDLDLGEKVLRHFDVSSQYGPCVGITRRARWVRAQRLGLAPPIEVLAVMIKEEANGVKGIQRSSFDDILNAPAVA
ncbi:MAG: hypothetical protein STHCBS139747_005437 [Sporothrix thermara]